jgi:uncharacterized membrane protein YhhN
MNTAAVALTIGCALAVAGLVGAEWRQRPRARRSLKLGASACFVLVAVALQAQASAYGQGVLVALVLGALGDACLLSERRRWFLAGLGLFLVAHLAYAVAFVVGGWRVGALALALPALGAAGIATLRWLRPHLAPFDRHAAAAQAWPVAAGALMFAASDLAVARDRYVAPGLINRAWGLPVYYAAQLLLAWSVV